MHSADLNIFTCLAEISIKLSDAALVTKAAHTCATASSECEALRIAMDLDALLHEAQTQHGAVCLIGRMTREVTGRPPDL